MCPIMHVPENASLHCARKNPLLHVLDTACARRNASLHVPEEMHHCMCLIMHLPEEMYHYIVPEEMHHCIVPVMDSIVPYLAISSTALFIPLDG